jgi:hypothetical protein
LAVSCFHSQEAGAEHKEVLRQARLEAESNGGPRFKWTNQRLGHVLRKLPAPLHVTDLPLCHLASCGLHGCGFKHSKNIPLAAGLAELHTGDVKHDAVGVFDTLRLVMISQDALGDWDKMRPKAELLRGGI